ncbi:MAG TPA: DUF397 domain-containing protein [Micromonospora sp.]
MPALDQQWRTSSRSGGNGACVEARYLGHAAEVRDSKDRNGPVLAFAPDAWASFLRGLKSSR